MSQGKSIVSFYADDKKAIWDATKTLMNTVEDILALVNDGDISDGNGGRKHVCEDADFFQIAAPHFRRLVTILCARSQSVPSMLRWGGMPIVEGYELAEQEQEQQNPGSAIEKPSLLQRISSVPRKAASATYSVLAPPLIERFSSEEMQKSVNTLQAEFRRLQIMAEDGWGDPKECREELAEKVGQIIGWIHSDTWQKALQQVMDLGRIGGSVFKEI